MAKKRDLFSGTPRKKVEYKYAEAERIRKERVAAARARDRTYRAERLEARKNLFSEYKKAIDNNFEGMTEEERAKTKYEFIKSIHDMIDKETSKDLAVYDSSGVADVIRQLEEDEDEADYVTGKAFKAAFAKTREKDNDGRKGSLNFF